MTKPKGGLGRGLAALIPTGPQTNTLSRIFLNGPPEASSTAEGEPVPAPNVRAFAASHSGAHNGTQLTHSAGRSWSPLPDGPREQPNGTGPRYEEVPIGAIRRNPKNPRTVFDEDALAELAHSVREFGLLQPIVVRPAGGEYELVMGERRWRAAQQAGLATVPAIVRATEDSDLLRDALLENIHRANLNPLEEAAAYQQLLEEFDVTQEELAKRIGRSRPVISNTIRLLKLPVAVQRRVAAGVLSAGHARALLGLEDPSDQEELAARVVAEGISVRGTEEAVLLVAGKTLKPRRSVPKRPVTPNLTALAGALSDAFDTRVKVELGRQKGKMVIEFATVDDLERIVAIMAPAALNTSR